MYSMMSRAMLDHFAVDSREQALLLIIASITTTCLWRWMLVMPRNEHIAKLLVHLLSIPHAPCYAESFQEDAVPNSRSLIRAIKRSPYNLAPVPSSRVITIINRTYPQGWLKE